MKHSFYLTGQSSKKLSMSNNSIASRNRVNVDLLGNTASQNNLNHINEEETKDRVNKNQATKGNIQLELQPPLIFAQFISLLPIYGTSDPNFKKLKYQWKSLKMIYSVFVILFNIALCAFAINRYVRQRGVTYRSLGDIIFYGSTLCTSIFFLKLGSNWKDFIIKWVSLQSQMNNFESLTVQKEIKLITICLISSSIFEHILSNTQSLLISNENADLVELFLYNENVFSVTGYNTFFAVLVYAIDFLNALIWNYTDIFLTAVSLSLANMFKQFNKDLELTSNNISNIRESSLNYWKRKREIYNSLSVLTKMVENKVSHLVLLSFASNLYFICIQLLLSIQPLRSLLQVAYFCGSFGHILFRTCVVCFSASSVYENSKVPLALLFSVPSEQYNHEVQRLITQLSTETLALTGCKFFTVTRTLLLTIAGTIVTYEVVLLQFNGLSTDDASTSASATTHPTWNSTSS